MRSITHYTHTLPTYLYSGQSSCVRYACSSHQSGTISSISFLVRLHRALSKSCPYLHRKWLFTSLTARMYNSLSRSFHSSSRHSMFARALRTEIFEVLSWNKDLLILSWINGGKFHSLFLRGQAEHLYGAFGVYVHTCILLWESAASTAFKTPVGIKAHSETLSINAKMFCAATLSITTKMFCAFRHKRSPYPGILEWPPSEDVVEL